MQTFLIFFKKQSMVDCEVLCMRKLEIAAMEEMITKAIHVANER